jgi:hypothetical protein
MTLLLAAAGCATAPPVRPTSIASGAAGGIYQPIVAAIARIAGETPGLNLPLDMSLVRGVDTEPVKQRLIGSMAALCKEFGIMVVAEGIETTGERHAMVALGCDLLQGFLLGRPVEAEAVLAAQENRPPWQRPDGTSPHERPARCAGTSKVLSRSFARLVKDLKLPNLSDSTTFATMPRAP